LELWLWLRLCGSGSVALAPAVAAPGPLARAVTVKMSEGVLEVLFAPGVCGWVVWDWGGEQGWREFFGDFS